MGKNLAKTSTAAASATSPPTPKIRFVHGGRVPRTRTVTLPCQNCSTPVTLDVLPPAPPVPSLSLPGDPSYTLLCPSCSPTDLPVFTHTPQKTWDECVTTALYNLGGTASNKAVATFVHNNRDDLVVPRDLTFPAVREEVARVLRENVRGCFESVTKGKMMVVWRLRGMGVESVEEEEEEDVEPEIEEKRLERGMVQYRVGGEWVDYTELGVTKELLKFERGQEEMGGKKVGTAKSASEEGKRNCMAEDHQILTNRGFLSLGEFLDAERSSERVREMTDSVRTLASGSHERLGVRSPVRLLGDEMIRAVSRFVMLCGVDEVSLRVACYDPADRSLRYQLHSALVVNGSSVRDMVEFSDRDAGVSLLVTPDHDMFVRRGREPREGGVVTLDDEGFRKLPASSLVCPEEDSVVQLLGAASSGLRSSVAAERTPCCATPDLWKVLGIALSCRGSHPGRRRSATSAPESDRLPRWLWDASSDAARAMIEGMLLAEPPESRRESGLLCSSACRRDEIMRLALHAGFSVSAHRTAGCWRVVLGSTEASTTPVLRASSQVRTIRYEGKTWCVTVPSGHIVVRRARAEGGVSRPIVVGNCHQCHNRNNHFFCCSACSRAYCANCLKRHGYCADKVCTPADFICARCQGICSCAACARRRGEIPLTEKAAARSGTPRSPQPRKAVSVTPGPRSKTTPLDDQQDDDVGGTPGPAPPRTPTPTRSLSARLGRRGSKQPALSGESGDEDEDEFERELDKEWEEMPEVVSSPPVPMRRRTSDFDADRIVMSAPTWVTYQPIVKPETVLVPSWKVIEEAQPLTEGQGVVATEEEDEDTSDERYERMHEEMKQKIAAEFQKALENAEKSKHQGKGKGRGKSKSPYKDPAANKKPKKPKKPSTEKAKDQAEERPSPLATTTPPSELAVPVATKARVALRILAPAEVNSAPGEFSAGASSIRAYTRTPPLQSTGSSVRLTPPRSSAAMAAAAMMAKRAEQDRQRDEAAALRAKQAASRNAHMLDDILDSPGMSSRLKPGEKPAAETTKPGQPGSHASVPQPQIRSPPRHVPPFHRMGIEGRFIPGSPPRPPLPLTRSQPYPPPPSSQFSLAPAPSILPPPVLPLEVVPFLSQTPWPPQMPPQPVPSQAVPWVQCARCQSPAVGCVCTVCCAPLCGPPCYESHFRETHSN